MGNDELNNKENEEKLESEQAHNGEYPIEPAQELSEGSFVKVDPYQNGVSHLESEQILTDKDSAIEDEKLAGTSFEEPSGPIKPPQEKEVKKMPGWLRKGLIFVVIAILLLLAGYLVSYFTATLPTQNSYQSALQDLKNKDNELTVLQTKFDQVTDVLTETKSNFDRLNQDYQSLELEHTQLLANSEFNQYLIDFKYEVSRAKFALLNDDRISANLSISLAKDKFGKIKDLLETDISSGMNDKLQEIQKLVKSNPKKALDELRTLNENLERIQFK